MTRSAFTRRRLGGAALAGATLIGAPLPLRYRSPRRGPPTSRWRCCCDFGPPGADRPGLQRGADVANDVFSDMKMPVRLEVMNYDTESSLTSRAPRPRRPWMPARMS